MVLESVDVNYQVVTMNGGDVKENCETDVKNDKKVFDDQFKGLCTHWKALQKISSKLKKYDYPNTLRITKNDIYVVI